MRPLAATLCLAAMLMNGCDESTVDLSPRRAPASSSPPPSISLGADSAVTNLESDTVDTRPLYRCTMGLRVRGSSTISGETAFWTGGSYQLVESRSDGPTVPLSVVDLVGWFDTDRVRAAEVITAVRTFASNRPFNAVIVTIQVDLFAEGEAMGAPQTLSTSFGCG